MTDARKGGAIAHRLGSRAAAPLATREDVAGLLDELAQARAALLSRTAQARAEVLGRVASLWVDGAEPLCDEAAHAIHASTGLARPMVAESLRRTLSAWRAESIAALLRDVQTDSWSADERSRSTDALWSHARRTAIPPELVVALLAPNTPGLAVAPIFTALALGAAIVVKPSRAETRFAATLAETITQVDAALGAACAVRVWRGGDDGVEQPLFSAAQRVIVYGRAETLASVRARAGERVVARGPRISVAVIAGTSGFPRDVARALSREIAFLDQRGCLSPQAVLVERSLDLGALGEALAHELAQVEREWPRRRLPLADAAGFRRAADEAEADLLAGRTESLHGGGGLPWAVVVERQALLRPTPLDRFVRLHPFADAAELRHVLQPLAGVLECVGLGGDAAGRSDIARACLDASAARLCPLDQMQNPPASWQVGAAPGPLGLLRWATIEGADQPNEDGSGASDDRSDAAPHESPRGLRGAGDAPERFRRFVAQTSSSPRAIEVDRALGSFVYDVEGRAFLDLLAGIGVAQIGHAHPEVARAVAAQVARYTHVMVYGEDVLAPQVELASRLAGLLPKSLSSIYFTSTGAEAIEGAIKLARKRTGRTRFIAFQGAFHGDTTGAVALGGNPIYRDPFLPLIEVEHLAWDVRQDLERIDASCAAVFVEPVQAEAGVRIPSPDFLEELAARCRSAGALLVFDEVVTAFGRTGRWFALEHWPGAQPDVVVLAKALGGGLPLGAFVASPDAMATLATDPPLGHVTTFGGNPVSCAAALASLDVLAREALPERAQRFGAHVLDELRQRVGRGGLVDARGLGMLVGLEFDRPAACAAFVSGCFERQVLLGWTLHRDTVVRLAPPLTLSQAELDQALNVFDDVLG